VRPGDALSVRATVLEARRSRSKPDRGLIHSLVEIRNQHGDLVLTMKLMNLIRCRKPR
jgi:acyl dehydratase